MFTREDLFFIGTLVKDRSLKLKREFNRASKAKELFGIKFVETEMRYINVVEQKLAKAIVDLDLEKNGEVKPAKDKS